MTPIVHPVALSSVNRQRNEAMNSLTCEHPIALLTLKHAFCFLSFYRWKTEKKMAQFRTTWMRYDAIHTLQESPLARVQDSGYKQWSTEYCMQKWPSRLFLHLLGAFFFSFFLFFPFLMHIASTLPPWCIVSSFANFRLTILTSQKEQTKERRGYCGIYS